MPMAGCHKSRGKYIVTGGEKAVSVILLLAAMVCLACLFVDKR